MKIYQLARYFLFSRMFWLLFSASSLDIFYGSIFFLLLSYLCFSLCLLSWLYSSVCNIYIYIQIILWYSMCNIRNIKYPVPLFYPLSYYCYSFYFLYAMNTRYTIIIFVLVNQLPFRAIKYRIKIMVDRILKWPPIIQSPGVYTLYNPRHLSWKRPMYMKRYHSHCDRLYGCVILYGRIDFEVVIRFPNYLIVS